MDEREWRERQAVTAAARAWNGTPYHHCGDVLGAGVDCGMIGVRVFCDLGLVPPFDPRPYPRDFMMHSGADEERYLNIVRRLAAREFDPREETPQPGDFVVWRWGRCFSHGGIVTGLPTAPTPTGWPWVVHAFADAERVVEEDMTGHAIMRLPNGAPRPLIGFSYWGSPA